MSKLYIGNNLISDTQETMLTAASDVGAIFMWGSDAPPKGCLICNGSAISRTTYSLLFAKIGTTYGAGDGTTTFNVPDMSGRVAVGRDTSQTEFDVLGETGGEKTHTLTTTEMPAHRHNQVYTNYYLTAGSVGLAFDSYNGDTSGTTNTRMGETGGSGAHNNLQLYRVLNFVIRYLPSMYVDNVSDTLPIGTMTEYVSDTVPLNWLLCNGQAVSRADYYELFAVIGVSYGGGDGSTTFNIPDMRGRVAVGKDTSQTEFDTLNMPSNYKGEKMHQLIVAEIPSHSHSSGGRSAYTSYWATGNTSQNGITVGDKQNTGDTGGGNYHNNLQPYRVLNYIIKAKNTVPVETVVEDYLTSTSTVNALSANKGKVLNDRVTVLERVVGCSVRNSTYITVPNAADFSGFSFDFEMFDTDNMHSLTANANRITFNTAGYYIVEFQVSWACNNTGAREIALLGSVNGIYASLGETRQGAPLPRDTGQQIHDIIYASAGDYLYPQAWQNSGGDLTMYYARFKAIRIV